MNKATQKSILRQLIKRYKRLGLGKCLRPRREMFALHKLRQEQIDRLNAVSNPKTTLLANIMFEALRQCNLS